MTETTFTKNKDGLAVTTRDALTALSLANLLFLVHWSPLLNRGIAYTLKTSVGIHLLATMLDVTLTASVFLLAAHLVRRSEYAHSLRFLRIAFLTIVFAAYLRWDAAENWLVQRTGKVAALLIPLAWCALAVSVATRPRVVRALRDFFLILSPFILVTFSQGLMEMIHDRARERPETEVALRRFTHHSDAPRIVWILFDELDYRLAFERRPASLVMPELDRLRAQALHASAAYPPSSHTLSSIPALLDGRLVAQSEPRDTHRLMITYHGGGAAVPWGSQPNLFSRARAAGVNSSVVGWFHPYCRVFRDLLNDCFWEEGADNTFAATGGELLPGMRVQAQTAVQLLLPAPFNGIQYQRSIADLVRRRAVRDHAAIIRRAQDALRDADLGLVVIHVSAPHPPGIFDRNRGTYRTEANLSYLDNLSLADRDLGDLRRVLEETDQWDGSVVVVSSDHAWRPNLHRFAFGWTAEDEAASAGHRDHRVPFLLKMPGQTTPLAYDQPFNTVLTSELLLAILRKEVSDAEGVVTWLERHRSIGLSPYMENP